MREMIDMADSSPNNTVGSVHVPGPIGAIRNQTPSGTAKQQPTWLKQHQPSRKPSSGGTK